MLASLFLVVADLSSLAQAQAPVPSSTDSAASTAPVPDVDPIKTREQARALAAEAQARVKATVVHVESGRSVDREHIRALGETGQARGRAALEARASRGTERNAERHPETRPASTGEGASPIAPTPPSGRLIVALSSSMPEAMVREYLRQLDGVPEGLVVLRGFIGGARTVAPTGVWVEAMRRREVACRTCPHRSVQVVVDPLTYRMLEIKQVPAVAYLPGVQDLKHCDAEVLKTSAIVYGAASIASALRELEHQGVSVPPVLVARLERRI